MAQMIKVILINPDDGLDQIHNIQQDISQKNLWCKKSQSISSTDVV